MNVILVDPKNDKNAKKISATSKIIYVDEKCSFNITPLTFTVIMYKADRLLYATDAWLISHYIGRR